MGKCDIEIVLDADVIIHFIKGDLLSVLPSTVPYCKFVVLDIVVDEVLPPSQGQLLNQMSLLHNIHKVTFGSTPEERREYARLTSRFGRGESASMVYCRFHNNVIGSSNLKDIKEYCDEHRITYLTTVDFLYYGIQNGKITRQEAETFIKEVRAKGSKLPDIDFSKYVCGKL